MIGLDTSAIIDIFKGVENIKKVLINIRENLVVTELSYLEIMVGINPDSKVHKLEEEYYDEFFISMQNFNLSKQACKKASQIHWNLKKQGKIIEMFDCVIAAIFLTNGVKKIITRNKKHFENIKELDVISY